MQLALACPCIVRSLASWAHLTLANHVELHRMTMRWAFSTSVPRSRLLTTDARTSVTRSFSRVGQDRQVGADTRAFLMGR